MVCWIGSARAPVTGSGAVPAWICWVSNCQVFSWLKGFSVQCGPGTGPNLNLAAGERVSGVESCTALS
ncbi:hypothetical protein GCM10009650_22200 [Nesterenkonia jeotgali]